MADAGTVIAVIQTLDSLFGDDPTDIDGVTANINASLVSLNENLHRSVVLETAETERLLNIARDLIIGSVRDSEQSVVNEIQGVTGDILLGIDQRNFATTQNVLDAERTIVDEILQLLILLNDENNIRRDSVIGSINSSVLETRANTDAIVRAATNPLLAGQDAITGDLLDLGDVVQSGFLSVNAGVGSILDVLARGIVANITNNVILDDAVFDGIFGSIQGIVSETLGSQTDVINGVFGTIEQSIREPMDIANIIALEELGATDRMANALEDANKQTADINRRIMEDGPEGLGGSMIGSVLGWLEENAALGEEELQEAATEALFGGRDPNQVLEECKIRFSQVQLGGDFATKVANFATSLLGIMMMPLNMAQVQANRQMFEFRKCFPDQKLPPGDAIASFQRSLISGSEAIDQLRSQGFSGNDAAVMIESAYRMPEIQFLFSMWYREVIDDSALEYSLEALGFNPAWIEPFKEIALFIPPVQDLITMAVREVFNPEVAQANGQFDDFPPEFAKFAAQQGVKEEWAQRYWAAHWVLPSPQMGFEMFHRRIIDEERLRGLMVALDMMPGWRDEMIAISYNPLTRVDVRRMHAMGVLTDEQTRDAYLDIGYSPTNADLMLEFTKRYNEDESILDTDIASDLTRSTIVNFYKKGTIDREIAFGLLGQAGINLIAAELFLTQADLDIEDKERSQEIDLIIEQYEFNQITYEQANDKLNALNIESRERELAKLALDGVQRKKTKVPPRSDLDKMVKEDLISQREYLDMLEQQGFSDFWSVRYLALAIGKEKVIVEPGTATIEAPRVSA